MSYFQNILESEFRANWLLGDRQYVVEFVVNANGNKYNYQLSWNPEPYDVSTDSMLTLYYAWDQNFLNYSALSIDVSTLASDPAAAMASEIAAALNANAIFAEMFNAQVFALPHVNYTAAHYEPQPNGVLILPRTGRIKQTIRLWVDNSGAQQELGFNKKAAIVELPLYMARHCVSNRFAFPDSQACLIQLSHRITAISVANPTQVTALAHGLQNGDTVYIGGSNSTPSIDGSYTITYVDADNFTIPVNVTTAGDRGEALSVTENFMVTQAGFNIANVQTDWQLLRGRSGIFNFQNITVDGSNRITQIIEYPAGAQVGDFARKIQYTYSGGNTQPSQITEIPYTLTAGDLVTPP